MHSFRLKTCKVECVRRLEAGFWGQGTRSREKNPIGLAGFYPWWMKLTEPHLISRMKSITENNEGPIVIRTALPMNRISLRDGSDGILEMVIYFLHGLILLNWALRSGSKSFQRCTESFVSRMRTEAYSSGPFPICGIERRRNKFLDGPSQGLE